MSDAPFDFALYFTRVQSTPFWHAMHTGMAEFGHVAPGQRVLDVAGMLAGVKPAKAAEFSFLLAVPAIAGASILQANGMSRVDAELIGPYIAGSVAAFVLGLVAVYAVLATIRVRAAGGSLLTLTYEVGIERAEADDRTTVTYIETVPTES